MKTNFTAEQMQDPLVAEAEPIIRNCVHYGFCTATCPTYVLFRDENDSPRGRIELIRAMLENGGRPDPKTVHHLDRCLSCLACMTTCAVDVDYHHLIDRGREYIEQNYRRPLFERMTRRLMAATLPHPRRMRAAMAVGRIAKPLAGLMPSALRAMLEMLPPRGAATSEILRPAVWPADGPARKRVALMPGCAQQVLDRNINAATIRLLNRLGCDVVVPAGVGCCGALTLHMGFAAHGRALAASVVDAVAAEAEGDALDAVVVNASGCGTTVKDYGHLLGTDPDRKNTARHIGALARDVSEFIAEIGLPEPSEPRAYRVAYHDACSLQHGQKVTAVPRELLRRAGYRVLDIPEGHFCCGSAGTYNLTQPDIAATLGRRKAGHIHDTDPEIVAMGNIGCLTQLRLFLNRPAVHTVELLDWATGGPMPEALVRHGLGAPREPAASPAEPSFETTDTGPPASPGFW